MSTRVYLEIGDQRIFACAVDLVGWARSARRPARMPLPEAEAAALAALAGQLPRFAPVAAAAAVPIARDAADAFEIVERVAGNATTDFGAPGTVPQVDSEPLTAQDVATLTALLTAAWDRLDAVAAAAPAQLRTGPRGGGRHRDAVVEHVVNAEASYVRKLGIRSGTTVPVQQWRARALEAIRGPAAGEAVGGSATRWPPRYAARRIAWHVLDHAWEIEDRTP